MPELYLGIDTSNYKTSIAVTDRSNNTVFCRSEYLEVPEGSRGLRQSEAFFRHSNRLPLFIDEMVSEISAANICAAGVSSRPRRVEGSYMPCFLAGMNAARELTAVLGIPLHEFSHQEGHAAAIIESEPAVIQGTAGLFHLSGGTSELLICEADSEGYRMEIAGGTRDISIGQLIDRAGVAMGFPFPSGAYLDELAESYYETLGKTRSVIGKVKFSDGYFNLSGSETQVLRMIESSSEKDYPLIAYSIFERISELLASSACYISEQNDIGTVYMAGGVSASSYMRRTVISRINSISSNPPEIIFGEPELSGDNAVGIARLARRAENSRQ